MAEDQGYRQIKLGRRDEVRASKVPLTSTQARLNELVLFNWARHMVANGCSISDLLQFVRTLSRMFRSFDEEDGNAAMSRIVVQPGFGGKPLEFWSCMWRTGHISGTDGMPSYSRANNLGYMTRGMYRTLVRNEKKATVFHLPVMKEKSAVAACLGIVYALYCFDRIGVTRYGRGRHPLRRFYPDYIEKMYMGQKIDPPKNMEDLAIKESWQPGGHDAIRPKEAGGVVAGDEERAMWRERIHGSYDAGGPKTIGVAPDSLLNFTDKGDPYDFTE